MVFERVKKKKNGKYRELVESYWDKEKKAPRQRVIKYLGVEVEEDGEKKVLPVSHKMDEIERSIPIGKLALYYVATCDIELQKVLKKYFPSSYFSILALIANQLCERRSLEKAAKWVNNTPLASWEINKQCNLDRNDLDTGLDKLCYIEDGSKINIGLSIQKEMAERCQKQYSTGRKYLFYDVTKITYYGYKCSYSSSSYNPNNRGKHSIGLGFVTSIENGFPIRCDTIVGSKNDTITMEDMVFALKNWNYKGIPIIVDRGMMSSRNINLARNNDFHVIGCCPDTSIEYENAVTLLSDEEICHWNTVVKRPSEGMVYVKGWKGNMYSRSGLIVLVLDPIRKISEKSNRDLMINELNETTDKKVIKELKTALSSVIIKSKGRRGFKIDYNLVEKEEKKDGRYLMFCTDQRLSAKKVFKIYFQRDEIEKTFKCLKGEMSLGPIRFQRPVRIDAYMTIVFLAYMLRTIVRYKLNLKMRDISVDDAIDELKSISLIEYSYKGKLRKKISRLTQKQELLAKALKIDEFIHSAENR